MSFRVRSAIGRYALGAVLFGAGFALTLLVREWSLGEPFYAIFTASVICAAWYGGLGPGLLVIGLSVLTTLPIILGRGHVMPDVAEFVRLAMFVAAGVFVSVLADARNRAIALEAAQHEALERERSLLDTVLHATDVMLVFLDAQFNFRAVNAAYAETCRMRPEEMVGRNHFELYPNAENEAIFTRVRDTGVPVFFKDKPFEFVDQPGRGVTYWDWSLVPVKDGSGAVTGLVFSLRETTEFKRAEEAWRLERLRAEETLRESESRYRNLFSNMQEGAAFHRIVTNEQGEPIDYVFLAVNPAFERLTDMHGVEGRRVTDALPGVEQSGLIEVYGRVALTGEATRFEQFVPQLGRHFHISAFSPLPGHFVAVFDDITESKNAERRLREQAEELAAANRMKDEFLATLSHELRTPLNAVLGWSSLLAAGSVPADRQQHALEAIQRNANAQRRIVEDLLDVSRIITGRLRLEVRPVDLGSIIAQAIETVRPAADARQIEIETRAESSVAVIADPGRLQQAIWNLVQNAVKFSEPSGRVEVTLSVHHGAARVQVRDHGHGIPTDFLPFVFERFRQRDSSTTRSFGGLGLGLAIVSHVIEMHGGTVLAESEGEGRGATFTVTLPLAEAPSETSRTVVAFGTEQVALGGMHVLVLDDEADARDLLVLTLGAWGGMVVAVDSAAAALDRIEQSPPQLVISDVAMAGMDGVAFIREVRARGHRMPALAVTAIGGGQQREQLRAAGFDGCVAKPVLAGELAAAITAAIATRT